MNPRADPRQERHTPFCPNFILGSSVNRRQNPQPVPIIKRVPLYDFVCRACDERFEARTSPDYSPACPKCGAADAQRQLSGFAGPFTVGLRGAAARRSNSRRQAREEQRQERREARNSRGNRAK